MMHHIMHKIVTSSESERDNSGGSDKTPNESHAALQFTFLKHPKLRMEHKSTVVLSSVSLAEFDK
jgi:hypothetical protein